MSYKPKYDLRGGFRAVARTAGTTVVAAHTASAGHLFAFRWDPAITTLYAYLRYVGVKFVLTTAYGTDQETGVGLYMARPYTVNHTGGAAVDTGTTVVASGKRRSAQADSSLLVNSVRVGTTGALTAGTHTLDANPVAAVSQFLAVVGDELPLAASGESTAPATLWDSRASGEHLVIAPDEGFIISNTVVMGATGVGDWTFTIEWDEGTPNGGQ